MSIKGDEYIDKLLLVISGPSGVGKGTIVKELVKNPQYALSISCTTRNPRENEKDGIHYFFKTNDDFEKMIKDGDLLEYAEYCGNYYGTPKWYVFDKMSGGKDVILEIEVQGALQVKQNNPRAILIFVMPPSMNELKSRLLGRGTETADVVEERLKKAVAELSLCDKYDYVITNDTVEKAVDDIEVIASAERKRSFRNKANM